MPIKRAAFKALRSDRKKRERNIAVISSIKTLDKKLTGALQAKNKKDISTQLKALTSALDTAAQKGIVHRKTASRRIARMSKKVHHALK